MRARFIGELCFHFQIEALTDVDPGSRTLGTIMCHSTTVQTRRSAKVARQENSMLENHGCNVKIADHCGSNMSAWADDDNGTCLARSWINDHRYRTGGELVYISVLDISRLMPSSVSTLPAERISMSRAELMCTAKPIAIVSRACARTLGRLAFPTKLNPPSTSTISANHAHFPRKHGVKYRTAAS
jgi:hypothetical protein